MLFFINNTSAQKPFASWNDSALTLTNGAVQRILTLPKQFGPFFTKEYKPVSGAFHYFKNESDDFSFLINDIVYTGKSGWKLIKITPLTDTNSGNGAAVTLLSSDKRIELTIGFLLYPNCPFIRKSLTIKNLTEKPVSLESVDVEKLSVTDYYPLTFSWVMTDYGRRKHIGPYEGNAQDALVMVHNPDWQEGIVIGNEAPGVLKRTAVFWNAQEIASGVTHKDNRFPFRKWIQPGESFTTPQVFTAVYNGQKNPDVVLNTVVPDFVRKHLGIRLSRFAEMPGFVYNTWRPFQKNINEQLIKQLAKAAADAGIKEFVIDDGWQANYGDWKADTTKFPNGLKPVFDYIKSLGMKPGLWISVGTAETSSIVYRRHPEWFIKNKEGLSTSQIIGENDKASACLSTGWYNHIRSVINQLSTEYGLEYIKLDFAVVTSAYKFDPAASGCYAANHPGHRDHNESLYTNYERLWQLFDDLHAANPGLFIDCTFEAMGGLQLIDYAMLKHAEGNWLSNFDEPNAAGDLRVRNMAWWRSPAMPATALVIGNPKMDDEGWELHIKSLAGSLPIMLGDPRKLSGNKLTLYRGYADWLLHMQKKHNFMRYRQDLPGFGEPMEGNWDGFARMNTDTKSGGIAGIFKQGSGDIKRQLMITGLADEKKYLVKRMNGDPVVSLTGKLLAEKGFEVTLTHLYDGELFEISELEEH